MMKEFQNEIRHLQSEIQEIETQIKDKNLSWNRKWLAPLMRGTVETMEETVKLLEIKKSLKQEMLNNLTYNNNEKN